jgi:disulfide bond formation protein DsbB
VAAVAAALVTQYGLGMQPCPWCVLQRVLFLAVSLVCCLGLIARHAGVRRLSAALGVLLALAGVAAALWQHFRAAASASCNLTLADRIVSGWLGLDSLLPSVFSARASCAEAAANLLGVPYEFWSLALYVLMAACLAPLTRPAPRLFR